LNPQPPSADGRRVHCVDGVSDEIQKYLLEGNAIYLHVGKVALEFSTHRYFPDLKIVFQQT